MDRRFEGPNKTRLLRTFKDSVFTDLFSRKEYTLQLYQALHPEDTEVDESDIELVTAQNVLTVGPHNDLGFIVGDRLLVLVEAQSTWSPNIVLRALMYAAQAIKDYVHKHELDVYGPTPVELPVPELYVVYTGNKRCVPDVLTMRDALFGGVGADIDAAVRVIRQPGPSIAGQYIDFARTMDAQRIAHGPGEETIREAIADCVSRGVLAEYLKEHEGEVVDIMISLFDEEEVLHNHIAAQVRAAKKEAIAEGLAEGRAQGLAEGLAEGRAEGRAEGIISTCKEFGATISETTAKVATKLGLSEAEAEELVKSLW